MGIAPCVCGCGSRAADVVRLLFQLKNGDIYVGSTNDLKHRFNSHQARHVCSTKGHLPLTLKSYVAVETEEHARELEAYFKSGSGEAIARKRLIRKVDPER